jgi:putative hemolysin
VALVLTAIALLLLASGGLMAGQTAVLALARLEHTMERLKPGARRAATALLARPLELLLAVVIFGETANFLAASLGTVVLLFWMGPAGAYLSVPVMFLLTLLVSDISAETLALAFPRAVAEATAQPLLMLSRLARPLARPLGLLNRPAWRKALSATEFKTLLRIGERHGEIHPGEAELIDRAFTFRSRRVAEIQTPRDKVFALSIDTPADQLLAQVIRARFSRVPIYRADLDNIVGIARAKDLLALRTEPAPSKLKGLLLEPRFVPASKTAGELLDEMRRERFGLALVVDEYGRLTGLVTLEDLVEELFGEIRDEFELAGPEVAPAGHNRWLAHGTASLATVRQAVGAAAPASEGSQDDTLSDALVRKVGRVPRPGERVRLDGLELRVERVRGATVELVQVRRWA